MKRKISLSEARNIALEGMRKSDACWATALTQEIRYFNTVLPQKEPETCQKTKTRS